MGWQNVFAVVFQAGNTIVINPQGFFVYQGAPVQGNLIASIAPVQGTDPFGNAYLANVTAYGYNTTGNFYVAAQIGTAFGAGGAGLNLYTAPVTSGPYNLQATCSVDTSGIWSFNANSYKFLASGNLFATVSQIVSAADTLIQQKQTSTWQGYIPSIATNMSAVTITAATFQNLTTIWNIPAKDANVGTVYRLTCGGSMGVGATLSALSLQLVLGSASINIPIGSAEFFASTTYGWRMQGEYAYFSGAQNSAQIVGSASFDMGTGTANMATVAGTAQTAGGFAQQTVVGGINFTAVQAMAFQAKWGSVIAGQQIVCNYSTLERIGP